MKYNARFVLPNVTANRCGISQTKIYDVVVESKDISPSDKFNYVVITSPSIEKDILMEVHYTIFSEDLLTISGWLTYDPQGTPTLCRGALELRNI